MKSVFLFLCALSLCLAHDEYYGQCPIFNPMKNFNWDRFSDGIWYATEKFDTHSKCLTYQFKEESSPQCEYVVEQTSVLTGLRRFSVDNKVKYRGCLAAPYNEKANMIVQFTLNPLTASFVVLDTDYTNYALICTCQGRKFLFDVLTFHRRSCTILQRSPERDTAISRKLHDLLNEQIPGDDDELPDHDFDIVQHSGCDYNDNGKGLQLDVEKILGTSQREGQERPGAPGSEYGDFLGDYAFDEEMVEFI